MDNTGGGEADEWSGPSIDASRRRRGLNQLGVIGNWMDGTALDDNV